MTDLAAHWQTAWQALGVTTDTSALREDVLQRYDEPHRHYHTRQHLEECFTQLALLRESAVHAAEIDIALFFHDAIYEVRRRDNEARSADWARQALQSAGVSAETADRVHALVMATRHAVQPATPDQRILVDVDLAILGAPPARFAEYEAQVRQEYAWVPGFIFRRKRREILHEFLARPTLYHTPLLIERLEARARANLAQAIRQLGG